MYNVRCGRADKVSSVYNIYIRLAREFLVRYVEIFALDIICFQIKVEWKNENISADIFCFSGECQYFVD